MNEIKQQQLTWNKGMTNIPSDLVCDDNTCESEVNMIYRDGEHRPIQDEQLMFEGNKLLPVVFVHKYNNYKHYISLKPDNTITWYDEEGVLAPKDIENAPVNGGDVQVEAIGNTLIVNSSNGLGYYLWKPETGNYKYLGNKIPEPEVEFSLICASDKNDYTYKSEEYKIEGILYKTDSALPWKISNGKVEEYNNLVIGAYSKNKKKIKSLGGFCNPFFLRYAIEMFDGSFTLASVPILVVPFIEQQTVWCDPTGTSLISDSNVLKLYTFYQKLAYKISCNYDEWHDIVKDVVLFISPEADMYQTTGDQTLTYIGSSPVATPVITGGFIKTDGTLGSNTKYKNTIGNITYTEIHKGYHVLYYRGLNLAENVLDKLKDTNVFYKVATLGKKSIEDFKLVSFKEGDLENLQTLPLLDDDYYSHCIKYGNYIKSHNGRIHLANVSRGFYEGGDSFILYSDNNLQTYDIYVYIHSQDGDRVIHKQVETDERIWQHYFFYPDPRAYKVLFTISDGAVGVEMELSEHPFLNGAYYLKKLPSISENDTMYGSISIPTISEAFEPLRNQIWTSEVNNPWVFTAKGNNTIGSGEILGLASQTTALSQGQFGQYPLIAFCTDGIWALQTDNEGLYSAVHPMSREICNNPKSITETDGYVFFTTEKGLMVVDGGQVRCVSEQMSGKMADSSNAVVYNGALAESAPLWLKDYLKNCYIAYDYRDSLLWIFIPNRTIAFVYSMKDGTFGMKIIPNIQRAINDYPDTLLQDKDGKVYSLLNRDDINTDSNSYDCELISRPMKLENSTALKTLSRVKLIYELTHSTKAEVKVFASNDCKNWVRVLSLHGRGFKYWKFAIRFREMSAVDTFSGALINTQERYTYRMR